MPENRRALPLSLPLSYGQNFLTSRGYIRKLIGYTDISPQDTVLEIGPGKGHITKELLPKCGRLIAVEADKKLFARLSKELEHEKKLDLHQGDFMRFPMPKEEYKVFANIPFGLTTAIIRRLVDSKNPPKAWLIVELGAARRFSQSEKSLTALSLRPYYRVRIAAKIDRGQFHPRPRVDAALLEIIPREKPDLPRNEREAWQRFLHQALKGGCGLRNLLTKRQIAAALRQAGSCAQVSNREADSNLRYVQWLCLFRYWRNLRG